MFGWGKKKRIELTEADQPSLAVAALLFEVADMDGRSGPDEVAQIRRLIGERLALDGERLALVIDTAAQAVRQAKGSGGGLYGRAKVIKEAFDAAMRASIVEMMWEVSMGDGESHGWESHFIDKAADLIGINADDCAAAREKVRKRLG
jgi:uncharacterized tellurite resistance protein B-like protein